MCNLYSETSNVDAIRALFEDLDVSAAGNMPTYPAVFPDYAAPIIRNRDGGRELTTARWGMPTPPNYLSGRRTDPGVTNIRNVSSAHWRGWLGLECRCLVPFTSFSENQLMPDGSRPPVWFAFDESRPLAFFAGIWTRWRSVRKLKEGEVETDIFAFLTCNPNAEVGAIHPKAMPVILTKREELELWMTAPWKEAASLQRPLADKALKIVARGEKQDGGEAVGALGPSQPTDLFA